MISVQVAGSSPKGSRKGAMLKNVCFLPLKTQKALENQELLSGEVVPPALTQLSARCADNCASLPRRTSDGCKRCSQSLAALGAECEARGRCSEPREKAKQKARAVRGPFVLSYPNNFEPFYDPSFYTKIQAITDLLPFSC